MSRRSPICARRRIGFDVKLCFSPTSPYVRKVRACAITREIDRLIELVPTDANASLPEFVAINPLSKVPALLTEDGVALFDSPVICEYLDSIGDALPMFPEHGALRWRALKLQAMGDGILDASVPRRGEMAKPQDEGRAAWIARQKAAVGRTLDALEVDPPHRAIDIGSLTVACALGYLDFRFAAQPWRSGHARLAAWYEAFAQHPGIAETVPKDPG
jgi:glutathione S-transferase